jgi:hypothetical protein
MVETDKVGLIYRVYRHQSKRIRNWEYT